MKGKYLITTDNWFVAPDGMQYKSVWGDCNIVSDSILGVTTNRNSSNWFIMVGSEENHVIIAGCQIHYAVRCEEKPKTTAVTDYNTTSGEFNEYLRPSMIWTAE